jgi:hypothetical protein
MVLVLGLYLKVVRVVDSHLKDFRYSEAFRDIVWYYDEYPFDNP